MDITELRTIIRSHLGGGVLTLTTADLGPGAAGTLLTTWFGGTLSVRSAQARDTDTGLEVDGTLSWLGVADRPLTGLAFTVDPADGAPALFLPFPLTADWHFGTSFPQTAASALDGLAFAAAPRLLLTSVPRQADHDLPALPAGLSFDAAALKMPTALQDFATVLRAEAGDDLVLSGPIRPGLAGAGPDIRLSSTTRDSGTTLGAAFALWAGSHPDSQGKPVYGVGLDAVLAVSDTLRLTLRAAADAPRPLVLAAEDLPPDLVPTALLADWPGTGTAVEQLKAVELGLSEKVTLSAADLTIDPTQLVAGGLAKALTAVSVTLATTPDFSWHVLDKPDLALTGAGATLTVATPLLPTRTATVTARADFLVADSVHLSATAEIPPGEFTLASTPGDKVELTDVLRHFLPTTDLSAIPRMTLTSFNGTVRPAQHSYALAAEVETNVPVPIGAATLTLTAVGAEFWHYGYPEKPVTGAHLSAVASLAPTGHSALAITADSARGSTGGSAQALVFHAEWWTPATFRLAATLPDIQLTELLAHLAADVGLTLPDQLPAITLKAPAVTVQRHTGGGYEFAVDTTAEFDGATGLGLVGKAATGGNGTVFAAALWQDGWTWSPKDVGGWPDLGILDALTFGRSGLAVSTADGQHIDGARTPPNLPATVDKGLTFFTEITFSKSGDLGFLNTLFPGADRITLTALLAAQVKNSWFAATIGAAAMQKGFGELRLTIKPASWSITLATTFVLDLSSLDTSAAPGNGALQFTGAGSVSKSGTGWELSLALILQGAAGANPGTLAADRLVLALDAPGHYLPAPAPDADLRAPVRRVADLRAPVRRDAAGTNPAWKNAFGIDGFDIDDFYLGVDYGGGVFSLGGGGAVTVAGSTHLELAVYGSVEPPDVSAFYFALTTGTPAGHGVSLHDIVAIVGTPPPILDFLKQIVLNELALCAVTVPGGWTNPVTKELWEQGFYAKGDIDFFHNSWRFKVRISATGLYVKSDVEKPMTIGSVLTLSDAGGTRGPQYLLDLSDLKTKIPEKVFAISGRIAILGVSASLDATLGTSGFTFHADLDLKVLTSHLDCTLGKDGLHATAQVRLDFDIPAPKGIPDILDISLGGTLTLDAGPEGASVALTLTGQASLLGDNVGDLTLTPSFAITAFDDLTAELKGSPEAIWKQLGDVFWQSVEKCAMTKASDAMSPTP